MFLQQLPRPYTALGLQLDDATPSLTIVQSAFRTQPLGIQGEDVQQRREVAVRILALVSDLSSPLDALSMDESYLYLDTVNQRRQHAFSAFPFAIANAFSPLSRPEPSTFRSP